MSCRLGLCFWGRGIQGENGLLQIRARWAGGTKWIGRSARRPGRSRRWCIAKEVEAKERIALFRLTCSFGICTSGL